MGCPLFGVPTAVHGVALPRRIQILVLLVFLKACQIARGPKVDAKTLDSEATTISSLLILYVEICT